MKIHFQYSHISAMFKRPYNKKKIVRFIVHPYFSTNTYSSKNFQKYLADFCVLNKNPLIHAEGGKIFPPIQLFFLLHSRLLVYKAYRVKRILIVFL